MVARTTPYSTPAEYLAAERRAETKSEYHDGQSVAMVSASRAHNLIAGDFNALLIAGLRGRGCETYASDMRVHIPARRKYVYPDVVAVCGEPEFEDAEVDTLANPSLVVEVLSPSTERYDRGQKFADYRSVPSLREFLLIAQDQRRIDYYRREDDGHWFIGEAQGVDATLDLAIGGGCTLALADIYERVTLPD